MNTDWLVWAGVIFSLLGTLVVIIDAFRVSIWWGLACLLIPGATLVFIFLYFEKARAGVAGIFFGGAIIGYVFWFDPDALVPYARYFRMSYWDMQFHRASAPVVKQASSADAKVSVYRCIDGGGNIRFADKPCEPGERSDIIQK